MSERGSRFAFIAKTTDKVASSRYKQASYLDCDVMEFQENPRNCQTHWKILISYRISMAILLINYTLQSVGHSVRLVQSANIIISCDVRQQRLVLNDKLRQSPITNKINERLVLICRSSRDCKPRNVLTCETSAVLRSWSAKSADSESLNSCFFLI